MPAVDPTLLVCTVGGSPAPLICSIRAHQPKQVLFLCSHASAPSVTEQILPALDVPPAWRIHTLADEQDLLACVEDMRSGLAEALNAWNMPPDTALLGDFTGGTKVMSAALVMALMENNVQFTYTGGGRRDKGGLGIVQDGEEKHLCLANPWQVLAFPRIQELAYAFNACQFPEAAGLALLIAEHGVHPAFFTALAALAHGYALWDGFRYAEAEKTFTSSLCTMEKVAPPSMASFLKQVHDNSLALTAAATERDAFITRAIPCPNYLLDLAANALRREAQGRFDDAVARLYSLLEKTVKTTLRCAYGLDTSDLSPERLPRDFLKQCPPVASHDGALQLPLFRAFQLLASLEHPLGIRFMEQRQELKALLQARNFSLLAHGFEPVSEETCARLRVLVLDFLNLSPHSLTAFPTLKAAHLRYVQRTKTTEAEDSRTR